MEPSPGMLTTHAILARALVHAGAAVVTHVPGAGGTEVFHELDQLAPGRHRGSFHEEVAYAIAHGAAIAGKRAAVVIKTHGFAKATNAVLSSLSCGTRAGLVVLAFDDRGGTSSDNIFDAEDFIQSSEAPSRRITPHDAYGEVLAAFERSEAQQLPQVLIIDCHEAARLQPWKDRPAPPPPKELAFEADRERNVVCPLLGAYQRAVFENRRAGASADDVPRPVLPRIPEQLPPAFRAAMQRYQAFFDVFRSHRGRIVTGDAGSSALFAFAPERAIDVVTYMGGSVPLCIGAHQAGYDDAWAITGDFSFLAAGHYALLEALQRELAIKVVVFADGRANATGGQQVPRKLLDVVLAGYAEYTRIVEDGRDPAALEPVLREAAAARSLRIVVVRV